MSSGPLRINFLGTGTSTGLPLTPCLTLTQPYPSEFAGHLPLPLTSTSSSSSESSSGPSKVAGSYDPKGSWPNNIPCACCRAAVSPEIPEGWKNKRGNTSLIVRKKNGNGEWRNVVVDVGKTFREQAMRFFTPWDIKRIDAVILTHGHADAYFGLDDLREWCFRQECVIPVYLDQETYDMVSQSFPYLVDKKKASGGGDIPALKFIIIDHEKDFEVEAIQVRPLPVEHGVYFRNDHKEPLMCLGFMFDESVVYMSDVSDIPDSIWTKMLDRTSSSSSQTTTTRTEENHLLSIPDKPRGQSNGIPIGLKEGLKDKVFIPPTPQGTAPTSRHITPPPGSSSTMTHISGEDLSQPITNLTISQFSSSSSSSTPTTTIPPPPPPQLPVLIIDSLWVTKRHASHFHFPDALQTALRLKPEITYLVDTVHPISHYMWEQLGHSISLGPKEGREMKMGKEDHPDNEQCRDLVRRFWDQKDMQSEKFRKDLDGWRGRVEPGWDGLVIEVINGVSARQNGSTGHNVEDGQNGESGKGGSGWRVIEGEGGCTRGLSL